MSIICEGHEAGMRLLWVVHRRGRYFIRKKIGRIWSVQYSGAFINPHRHKVFFLWFSSSVQQLVVILKKVSPSSYFILSFGAFFNVIQKRIIFNLIWICNCSVLLQSMQQFNYNFEFCSIVYFNCGYGLVQAGSFGFVWLSGVWQLRSLKKPHTVPAMLSLPSRYLACIGLVYANP